VLIDEACAVVDFIVDDHVDVLGSCQSGMFSDSKVAGRVVELVEDARVFLVSLLYTSSSFARLAALRDSAHLLGVVLGNVRVGEFLRHSGGCCMWCVVCRDEGSQKDSSVSKVRANVRVEKVDKGRWYRASKEQGNEEVDSSQAGRQQQSRIGGPVSTDFPGPQEK